MTSNNMLAGRRHPNRMGSALAIQNFAWSAGAVACPILVAQFLRHATSASAFGLLGFLVIPFAFLPVLADRRDFAASTAFGPAPAGIKEAATIVYFALLAFLYVGMEASVGNWMSTYATRATAWRFAGGSLAVAVFWAALLLGRATTPVMLRFLTERRLYRACVIVTIAGIALLLAAHSPGVLLAGSALTGLALAPLFPLILSLFLGEIGRVAQRRMGLCHCGIGRSCPLMVDGDRFQRYRLTAHRPDGAGRRCPSDDGLDHLAPI